MALKVLLADPEREWLDSASEFFQSQLYKVDTVVNGKDVQLAFFRSKYFALIMNYSIKNHSSLQVLKFIKNNYPAQKVVLVVDNDALLIDDDMTEDDLKKLGVTEIVYKPLKFEELNNLLEGQQSFAEMLSVTPKRDGVSEEVEVQGSDEEFTRVKIDSFYALKSVLFDLYIKLKSNRYIKILHAGDSFDRERLDKYRIDKKVEFLYFKNVDRRKYIQMTNYLGKKIIGTEGVNTATKLNMIKNISEKYVEEVFTEGLKPMVIEQGKEVCKNVYSMIEKNDDLYLLLRDYSEFDPNAFSHAYLVTLFSSSIIKQFEWQSQTTIETTAMACMFHDIGKMKLDPALRDKRPEDMTEEELEQYKQHPVLGAEIVQDNNIINNAIKQIIIQHHEKFNGEGFPFGIKGSKILTLSNIVCLADDFVRMIMKEKCKPVVALKQLLSSQEKVACYNSMILENFINTFSDPEKVAKKKDKVF